MLLGCSFRNSSIEFREKFARWLAKPDWREGLPIREWALLVTCNRVEAIVCSDDPDSVALRLEELSTKRLGEAPFYFMKSRSAIEHVFRVAAGLDSMVINDGQILGQLTRAGKEARIARSSKAVLSSVLDAAVGVSKRVAPMIPDVKESVGERAVEFARRRLGRVPRDVLLIGSGKISRHAAISLKKSRVKVVSHRRTLPTSLAGFELVSKKMLKKAVASSELVISATSGKGYALKSKDVTDGRQKLIIDLGFPRNVDPAVREAKGVELYDLDDFAQELAIGENRDIAQADKAIEAEAESFDRWLNAKKLSPDISEIFKWVDEVRSVETASTLRRLRSLTPRERELVESMGRRIASKILARPAEFARLSTPDLSQELRLKILSELFSESPP